jgi:hypothetical protein
MPPATFRWTAAAALLAAIVVASLIPASMQLRTGLNWLTEHFLLYFIVTTIFCLAWPRPLVVGGVLAIFAGLLEALQGLTPDRTPDLATAAAAIGGIFSAALLFAAVTAWKGRKLA